MRGTSVHCSRRVQHCPSHRRHLVGPTVKPAAQPCRWSWSHRWRVGACSRLPRFCVRAFFGRYTQLNLLGARTLTFDRLQRSGNDAGESNSCADRLWRNILTIPRIGPGAEPRRVAPASAFATIPDTAARSRALFTEAAKVFMHPRCTNCHPATDRNYDLHEGASYRSIPGHPALAIRADRNGVGRQAYR
jgi:hypothetical protein